MINKVAKSPSFSHQQGLTIIELLVAMTILGILAAIAVPTYRGYIETSQEGVLRSNMMSIEMFQEDFFLRNGAYANDLADIAAIENAIGWNPRTEDGITYSIAASDGTFYRVTGVHPDGLTVCIDFPDKDACP